MFRRCVNWLSALSLIIAVISFESWFHSSTDDPNDWTSCSVCFRHTLLRLNGGGLWYVHSDSLVRPRLDAGEGWGVTWYSFGFASDLSPYLQVVRIPLWWITIAALLFTTSITGFATLRRRLRSSSAGTLCPNCRYDIRATPHRCPECGRVLLPRKTTSCED